jgi:hypothetical protein
MVKVLFRATVLWCLVAAACGGSSPTEPAPPVTNPPPPAPVRWTLSGTITDDGPKTPLAGARVAIVEGTGSGRSALADAQGHYQLDALDAGTASISITAEGFETETRSVDLNANVTLDVALRRSAAPPPPPPPQPTMTGTAIDGVSDRPLSGVVVHIDGIGDATTGADGSFQIVAPDPEQVRPVTITSSSTLERRTHLRVPGPPATLSLIPRSIDLVAFDQMFRSGGALIRWTSPPSLVLQTRVLQFTNVDDAEYTAADEVMSDAEVDGLVADLLWALPQLTGDNFTAFAGQQRETAAPGDRVRVTRPGQIVVARFTGLQAATTFSGYGRWQTSGGEVRAGVVMLDDDFEKSGSPFRRTLRTHELGHSLGYNHVTARDSVMNSTARFEPNAFDKAGAKLAFLRPPLNQSPDIDPDPFTPNLRTLLEAVWHGAK